MSEQKVYRGNVVQAGPHTVKGRTRQHAWNKLHRQIARDVLGGDSTLVTLLPDEYRTQLAEIERKGGLRLQLARRGWRLP